MENWGLIPRCLAPKEEETLANPLGLTSIHPLFPTKLRMIMIKTKDIQVDPELQLNSQSPYPVLSTVHFILYGLLMRTQFEVVKSDGLD